MNSSLKGPEPDATALFREAAEAPSRVAAMIAANRSKIDRLAKRVKDDGLRAIVMCARGSSDNAATYGRYLIETKTGILTSSSGLSVHSIYEADVDLNRTLFLAISQSGRSPDLLASVARARANGALTVALVNDETSPLASLTDEVIALCAGRETSVAATKSYISSLAALAEFVAALSGDSDMASAIDALPEYLDQAWNLDWMDAVHRLAGASSLYTIGRGPGLGVAQEAALKLKETAGLHAEATSAAELMHGPTVLAGRDFPAFIFAQDDPSRANTVALAESLVFRDVAVLVAGAKVPGACVLPTIRYHGAIEPILMIQSFYRLTAELCAARNCNPDAPHHLTKVTKTL